MDVVLAVDIGGTKISLLVQALNGTEIARRVLKTRPDDYSLSQEEITTTSEHLTRGHRLVAAGVGIAGVVVNGVLTGSGNLPGWVGHDIESDLQQALQVPVTVLNDAKAAGLGEYAVLGRSIIYVIWGTGVGAAIIINDEGYVLKLATELGHIVIDKNSRLKCGCGGYGHLEAHVSGVNIPKRRFGFRRGIKAEHLTNRQWDIVLQEMAIGLRSISNSAPGLPIVMGGGIATKQAHRLPVLQHLVGKLKSSCPAPTLHLAEHGEDSGLMGAAYAARQLVAA
jgi:predicted NBD/HSP70 family sugar kinase